MSHESHFHWAFTHPETGREYVTPWPLSVAEALSIDPQAQVRGHPIYVNDSGRSPESREAMAGAVRASVHASLLIQTIQHREDKDEYKSEAERLEDYRHVTALFDRARALLALSRETRSLATGGGSEGSGQRAGRG